MEFEFTLDKHPPITSQIVTYYTVRNLKLPFRSRLMNFIKKKLF